ncbi:MAG: malonyl-ACP O-methyltransferase BioC [Clostridium sp.]
MIDKRQVKIHFTKNAKTYDQYAHVQKSMAIKLLNNLAIDPHLHINILEIGCGTGYLTKNLQKTFINSTITAVDIADGMIEKARENTSSKNIKFICGDIEDIGLTEKFDLIISNATFQWLNNLPKTINYLYSLLKNDGILTYSTFGKDTFKELKECYLKASLELNIHEFKCGQDFLDVDYLTNIIQCETLANPIIESYQEEFQFNNCNEFFKSIKKVGASNSNAFNRCTSPAFLKKVIDIYNKDYTFNNNVIATYHYLLITINNSK